MVTGGPGMNSIQKLFLLLIAGYFAVKGILALLMYLVTKRVEEKGHLFQRKKQEIKNKAGKTV